MRKLVICNTTPLFYLHTLKHLSLLEKLYQRITIPQAVVEELKAGQTVGEDVPKVTEYKWIEVRRVKVPELLGLITDLGAGEAQVLALALEEPDSLVIVDDLLARTVGKLQNLQITGTVGVLLKAKQLGYIPKIRPLLEQLLELGFWVSKELKENIVKLANE